MDEISANEQEVVAKILLYLQDRPSATSKWLSVSRQEDGLKKVAVDLNLKKTGKGALRPKLYNGVELRALLMNALDVGRERSVTDLTHLFSRGLRVLSPEALAHYGVILPAQLDPNTQVADSMETVEGVEQVEDDHAPKTSTSRKRDSGSQLKTLSETHESISATTGTSGNEVDVSSSELTSAPSHPEHSDDGNVSSQKRQKPSAPKQSHQSHARKGSRTSTVEHKPSSSNLSSAAGDVTQVTAHNRSSPQKRATNHATKFVLKNSELYSGLQSISDLATSLARDILYNTSFSPVANPGPELRALYVGSLGSSDWLSRFAMLQEIANLDPVDFLSSVVAAWIRSSILQAQTPWRQEVAVIVRQGTIWAALNHLLAERDVVFADLWNQAHLDLLQDPVFRETILPEHVCRLVDRLTVALLPQISCLHPTRSSHTSEGPNSNRWRPAMAFLIEQSLLLKAKIEASAGLRVTWPWYDSGEAFEVDKMESIYVNKGESSSMVVGITVIPGLSVRRGEDSVIIKRAMVTQAPAS